MVADVKDDMVGLYTRAWPARSPGGGRVFNRQTRQAIETMTRSPNDSCADKSQLVRDYMHRQQLQSVANIAVDSVSLADQLVASIYFASLSIYGSARRLRASGRGYFNCTQPYHKRCRRPSRFVPASILPV